MHYKSRLQDSDLDYQLRRSAVLKLRLGCIALLAWLMIALVCVACLCLLRSTLPDLLCC